MTRIRKRYVHCVKCSQWRWNKGRGLCSTCQETERLAGRLTQWADDKPDTQGKVLPFYLAGEQPAQVAARLGITRNAASCAFRALRAKGVEPVTANESPWARLYVSPPAAEPECVGATWTFVDKWDGNTRHLMRDGAPDVWARTSIAEAFAMCARCPVRDWCVAATAPESSKVTIIAGGTLWHDGVAVWTLTQQEALEAAQDESVAS